MSQYTRVLGPAEVHLDSICKYAESVPDDQWKLGHPPQDQDMYFAIKTETGRILSGRTRAFRPSILWRLELMPKYGKIIKYLEIGD